MGAHCRHPPPRRLPCRARLPRTPPGHLCPHQPSRPRLPQLMHLPWFVPIQYIATCWHKGWAFDDCCTAPLYCSAARHDVILQGCDAIAGTRACQMRQMRILPCCRRLQVLRRRQLALHQVLRWRVSVADPCLRNCACAQPSRRPVHLVTVLESMRAQQIHLLPAGERSTERACLQDVLSIRIRIAGLHHLR
jgi:hypothetical protein